MNFAIFSILLALAACAHSSPALKGIYTDNKMFEGDIDDIQGMMLDIVSAGEDLAKIEGKLSQIVAEKEQFEKAEKVLEGAVNKDIYLNEFKAKAE